MNLINADLFRGGLSQGTQSFFAVRKHFEREAGGSHVALICLLAAFLYGMKEWKNGNSCLGCKGKGMEGKWTLYILPHSIWGYPRIPFLHVIPETSNWGLH